MKGRKLLDKTMLLLSLCIAGLMLLATPLFYFLTKFYYAEDLMKAINIIKGNNKDVPTFDLEEDIMQGVMLQFGLITVILGVAILFMMKFISRKLWQPFNNTLVQIDKFKLEDGVVPFLPDTDIAEFRQLNNALRTLMDKSLKSYNMQKEFTENASHELQTPLAVFNSKLDVLLQDNKMTREQADIFQDLYNVSNRLTRLNKNLLLLARIENDQYAAMEDINVVGKINEQLPLLYAISEDIVIKKDFRDCQLVVKGNKILFESMINNLIVNAVRHNKEGGEIFIKVGDNSLVVSNTSDGEALDEAQIFNRFYRPSEKVKGNGLGLSIVKAICEYHKWGIQYNYKNSRHYFSVHFVRQKKSLI